MKQSFLPNEYALKKMAMVLKDRICILFFCHSHSHSALSNVYPVALESTRR